MDHRTLRFLFPHAETGTRRPARRVGDAEEDVPALGVRAARPLRCRGGATVAITRLQVVTSVLAAYGFAFLRFPGRPVVFAAFMATLAPVRFEGRQLADGGAPVQSVQLT